MGATLAGTLLFACAWTVGCGGDDAPLYMPSGGGPVSGWTSGGTGGSPSAGSSDMGGGSSSAAPGASSGSSSSGPSPDAAVLVEAGPTPPTCSEAIKQLGACMSYADFTTKTTNGFAASDLATATTTTGNSPCNACHNVGDGGFYASTDSMAMFQGITQFPYILMWATQMVGQNGTCTGFTPSTVIVSNGAQPCASQTACHPNYTLDPSLIDAVDTFVSRSIARWQSGMCSTAAADDGGTE